MHQKDYKFGKKFHKLAKPVIPRFPVLQRATPSSTPMFHFPSLNPSHLPAHTTYDQQVGATMIRTRLCYLCPILGGFVNLASQGK